MFCVVCVFSHLILIRSGGLQMLTCMFLPSSFSHHIQNLSNIFSSSGCVKWPFLKFSLFCLRLFDDVCPFENTFFYPQSLFLFFVGFLHEIQQTNTHTHTYTTLNLLYIHILFLVLLYYIIRPPIESLSSSFLNLNFRIGFLLIFQ